MTAAAPGCSSFIRAPAGVLPLWGGARPPLIRTARQFICSRETLAAAASSETWPTRPISLPSQPGGLGPAHPHRVWAPIGESQVVRDEINQNMSWKRIKKDEGDEEGMKSNGDGGAGTGEGQLQDLGPT